MPKKTYIRAPNDDYAPNNNIRLGCIWSDPRDPGSFVGPPLPIPDDIQVNHTFKSTWNIDLGRESSGQVGFWAKIAQLPVRAGVGANWNDTKDGVYKIPKMDTYSIEPTLKYVQDSIDFISSETIKKGYNLYMITGVKIARGGEGSNKEAQSFGTKLEIGIDSSATIMPVKAIQQVNYSKSTRNHQSFASTGDFVFAYRVREIIYKKKTLKTREYNKGAVMGHNLVLETKGVEEPQYFGKVDFLEDDDYEVEGEQYHFMDDDDEESSVFIQPI
ncbi:hypothetical protein GQ53DRAFT_748573 [Thozetella sp. PMI_491]|nr:hypothetical protein GQ53DRAFT_748573 [Thozetella sp. PMI_491]